MPRTTLSAGAGLVCLKEGTKEPKPPLVECRPRLFALFKVQMVTEDALQPHYPLPPRFIPFTFTCRIPTKVWVLC